jgi:NADH:ubiquinone oxidoreductase subunit 5 (subunit L)/multisubunit Na+/H+ antiporter MnhA subunit
MLFSSGILAVLCFAWGFLANSIATFMHVNVQIGLSEVFSSSTLIFILVLLIGGVPVYIFYYRKSRLTKIVTNGLTPLKAVLEHDFFFDDLYEKVVAGGIMKVSEGLEYIEKTVFTPLPYFLANGVMTIARGTHKYFDILVDRMLYAAADKTVASASKIGKTHNESLQRYIVAALLGFLVLLIIVIVTLLKLK